MQISRLRSYNAEEHKPKTGWDTASIEYAKQLGHQLYVDQSGDVWKDGQSEYVGRVLLISNQEGDDRMRQFITAKEVAEIMGISTTKAYQIIRQLNTDLEARGYITVSGKVSRAFFEEKCYGVKAVGD